MSHKTPGIKHFTHLFPNTQIMQFQCDDIWRRVDQLNFRFGDELTSRPRRRDDQGDELTCNHPDKSKCIVYGVNNPSPAILNDKVIPIVSHLTHLGVDRYSGVPCHDQLIDSRGFMYSTDAGIFIKL